jgi:hypothetical protein
MLVYQSVCPMEMDMSIEHDRTNKHHVAMNNWRDLEGESRHGDFFTSYCSKLSKL